MAHPDDDPPVDWVEGVAIIVAVLIVVSVGSLNDGQKQLIHVHDAVVGDIVLLEPGKVIPCNRVFLSGHNVRCDESSATGDLDAIKKLPYQVCITLRNKQLTEFDPDSDIPIGNVDNTSGSPRKNHSSLDLPGHMDCFVVSGSKVVEGLAHTWSFRLDRKGSTVISCRPFSQKPSHIWFPRHVQMLVIVGPPDSRPMDCISGSGRPIQNYIPES
jgi:hypothetical protein